MPALIQEGISAFLNLFNERCRTVQEALCNFLDNINSYGDNHLRNKLGDLFISLFMYGIR